MKAIAMAKKGHRFEEAFVVSAVRTPVGKFGGVYRDTSAVQLGTAVVRHAITSAGISPEDVDEVILGNVLSAGLGQAPARQCAIHAGVPLSSGSFSVNKVCGSGLKAIMLAANSVRVGENSIIVAGGIENMSMSPYISKSARWGSKYGNSELQDSMIVDGLWDVYNDFHMMMTGEIVAERFNVSREEADAFAYASQKKALNATEEGHFREEIVPLDIMKDGKQIEVSRDEGLRPDTTFEKLAALKPKFKENGICTAGNSSQLSDGASAVVVMSESRVEEMGIKPIARIVDYVTGGTRPEWVMEAPIETTRKLLKRNEMEIDAVDLVEHNEAYASASVAVMRALEIDKERFNISGGAVALGHPLGASGARITTTLLHNMKRLKKDRGLSTLCLGGGNAVSMLFERC
jgi:acetyl-CoA C-acetyltransferase